MKVGFYGPVFEPTGYGCAARGYVGSLLEAGIELSVVNTSAVNRVFDPVAGACLDRRMEPDFHLFHGNPLHYRALTQFFPRIRLISIIAWETDTLPRQWIESLNDATEVWVPCAHNVSVCSAGLATPVFRWPHPLATAPSGAPDFSRMPPLPGDTYLFYSTFAWQNRKSPLGIVESFFRAFPAADAALLLKISGPRGYDPLGEIAELRERTGSKSPVLVEDDYWTPEQMEALAQRGDCYVSLHRGEAWCYPLFDAACRGKPVIATAYSGPLDYLDSGGHFCVRYEMTPVDQDWKLYDRDMRWASPDVGHAAELMRYVFENRDAVSQRAERAACKLRALYSPASVGRMARERLTSLLERNQGVFA